MVQGILSKRQGQNLAWAVLCVPHSLDSGQGRSCSPSSPTSATSSGTTRWTRNVSFPSIMGYYVTKFPPHWALQSIAWRQVDFELLTLVTDILHFFRYLFRSQFKNNHLQPLRRNVKRFRGGLVFKAHRLVYHSPLGLRVVKKKKKYLFPARCRANVAHIRQPRPDSGPGFKAKKILKPFQVVAISLGSGPSSEREPSTTGVPRS